ncbi:MAG: glycosyltransferase [Thermoplasmata archaeon]|nr:glycosyltransferase [Thermoplasmata archaeon]
MAVIKILQLAHGRIIPPFYSGYSRRCHDLFRGENRKIISIGGPFIIDRKEDDAEQYSSLSLLISSILKGNRSFEILISRGRLRKKFIRRAEELIKESDVIVFEGPWLYRPLKNILGKKFIVYDAHNVEYILRKNNPYQEEVKEIEGDLVKNADLIFLVTSEDMEIMKKTYELNEEKLYLIPIQLEIKEYKWRGENSKDIVFIGSLYEANILALKEIEKIAEKLDDFTFHIIGSLKNYPKKKKLKNIVYHGTLEEEKKDEILNSSFLALNPVTMGSGRNVKMVDYIIHGLPVLTTPLGARGFNIQEIKDIIFIENLENFPTRIIEISKKREVLPVISKRLYDYGKILFESETSRKPLKIIEEKLKVRRESLA